MPVYFTAPQGDETFGDVKLGGFESARVHPLSPVRNTRHAVATQIITEAQELPGDETDDMKIRDIAALGCVLYQMMDGEIPQSVDLSAQTTSVKKDNWVKALPARYTPELREIVRSMMSTGCDPPNAIDLAATVDEGMKAWRENTMEGRRFVSKSDFRGRN